MKRSFVSNLKFLLLSAFLPIVLLPQVAKADTVVNDCLTLNYESFTDRVELDWIDPWANDTNPFTGTDNYTDMHGYTTRFKIRRTNPAGNFNTIGHTQRDEYEFTDDNVDENDCHSYYVEKSFVNNHAKGHPHYFKGKKKCQSETVEICATGGGNNPPVADAGADQNVPLGNTAELDGSSSADPDNDPITYSWTIISKPAGSTATLDDPTAEKPSFTADVAGEYVFELVVNDGQVNSTPDQVIVNTTNTPPIADAGADVTAFVGDTVNLDGSASSDPDGDPLTYLWEITSQPVGSTATLSDGTLVNPSITLDVAGSYTIRLVVNDGTLDSPEAIVNITTDNRTPTADAGPDQQIDIGATANFDGSTSTDPDNDPITYSWIIISAPVGSAAILQSANTATPSLTPDLVGVYQLELSVSDQEPLTATDTIILTVIQPNRAPTADDTSETVDEDQVLNFTLQADDLDSDPLTYTIETLPTNGVLSGTAPNLTYTPNPDFNGVDSIQFSVNDGEFDSNIATVDITVNPINDPPISADQSLNTNEDTPLNGVLAGTDIDSGILNFTIVTQPANGVLSGTLPNFTYTPNADFNGSDSFTYQVGDGAAFSDVATISISVAPVNDAPTANAASVNVDEDGSVLITLTGSDPDGDTLTFNIVTQPSNGTLSGTAPNLTYTPDPDFEGTDSFTFEVTDGTVTSAAETISITIASVDDAPVADNQSVNTDEDTAVNITLTGSDADGDSITFNILTPPANGMLTGTAPNLTYTPNTDFNGSDSFTFEATDGTLSSAAATVSITVNPINDPPTADPASIVLNEDGSAVVTLTGSDPDGDTLTFNVLTQPTGGTLSGTAPNLTYTPDPDFEGSDSFTFEVTDGTTSSGSQTISITVTAINDAPTADDQSVVTDEDVAVNIALTGGDVDGDAITFNVLTQPTDGVLTGTAPNLVYTPNADFNGADSFTFETSDGTLNSSAGTVSITVNAINDTPTADAQSLNTDEDVALAITLTGSDPDGDTLTFSIVNSPANGVLTGTAPSVTYTPDPGFSGADSFTFVVNDGTVDSTTATISITVIDVNDPPSITTSPSVSATQDQNYVYDAHADDPNPSDLLTYSLLTSPAGLTIDASTGEVNWVPDSTYVSPVSGTNNNCFLPQITEDEIFSTNDYNAEIEWSWTGSSIEPLSIHVRSTPIVANLNDDNNDSLINTNDIPDIIFITVPPIGSVPTDCQVGTLRAISGDGSGELFSVDAVDQDLGACIVPAVADLEGDGQPEIVAFRYVSDSELAVMIFNNDGTLKHRGDNLYPLQSPAIDGNFNDFGLEGAIEITDLESDGIAEIIAANTVFDNEGKIIFMKEGYGVFSVPADTAADIDLDGIKEVFIGHNIYNADGSLNLTISNLASMPNYPRSFPFVANFDSDQLPEIPFGGESGVGVVESNGTSLFSPISFGSGALTIGDFDNDGAPEYGVLNFNTYRVFDNDGSLLWLNGIFTSGSNGINSAALADLNGDGQMELIVPDQHNIHIFRASNGDSLGSIPFRTNRNINTVVPVDVDGDGQLELVVSGNSDSTVGGTDFGIHVYGNATWATGTKTWNQHNYAISNIEDDMSLPNQPVRSWLLDNSVRAQPPVSSLSFADLALTDLRVEEESGGTGLIRIKAINRGALEVLGTLTVRVYSGTPSAPGTLLAQADVVGLADGETKELQFPGLDLSQIGSAAYATIDETNVATECAEDNNYAVAAVVEIQVADDGGLTDTQLFSLNVSGSTDAPVITSSPPLVTTTEQVYVYQVEASDNSAGDQLTFSLQNGPTGMEIDPVTGILRWFPTLGLSSFDVTIQVEDFSGNTDSQTFTVDFVDSCDSPVFAGELPDAIQNAAYVRQLDVFFTGNLNDLVFSLINPPAGMTINSSTGELSWTPTTTGPENFIIVAEAPNGLRGTKEISLEVLPPDTNPPNIQAIADRNVDVNRPYTKVLSIDNESIEPGWQTEILTGPVDMTIDENGLIVWMPSLPTGPQPIVAQVTDLGGNTDTVSYTLTVVDPGRIPGPTVTSTPPTSVNVGDTFSYQVTAVSDPAVAFPAFTFESIIKKPSAMGVNSSTKTFTWTPTDADIGTHEVIVHIRESFESTDHTLHRFTFDVLPRACGTPVYPQFTSTPIGNAVIGSTYTYPVTIDLGTLPGPASFSIASGPAGVFFNPTFNTVEWDPVTAPAGLQQIVLDVSANGVTTSQTFYVQVTDPVGAPFITSTPPDFARVGDPFTYDVDATDPALGTLQYFLARAPIGMTIDTNTGLISWTPVAGQDVPTTIEIVVPSTSGKSTSQVFSLVVRNTLANAIPSIDSVPFTDAKIGMEYIYDVDSSDSDGDIPTYSLLDAPIGMSIDSATGVISWFPSQTGTYPVEVEVFDGVWGYDTQSFNIVVVEPTEVDLSLDKVLLSPSESFTATLVATAGVIAGFTLEVEFEGTNYSLTNDQAALTAPTDPGLYTVRGIYTDRFETIVKERAILVSLNPSAEFPVVNIDSPAQTTEITKPEDIFISVADTNLDEWTLSVIEIGSFAKTQIPTVIATGNTELTNQLAGSFDPTLLTNGLYELTLEAVDTIGLSASHTIALRVDGEMKVGNFTITFVDLSIPVSGVPITVTRTYDSRERNKDLDFGFGWSVGYQAMKVAENKLPGRSWDLTSTGGVTPTFCVEPGEETYVAITLPDGDVEEFDLSFDPPCQPLVPITFVTPVYTPRAGTSSTLRWKETYPLSVQNGEIFDPVEVQTFDPSQYIITTKDGIEFEVTEGVGIRKLTDPNANILTFTDNGIFHSDGKSILFNRDSEGRIIEVVAPDNTKLTYSYNASGDLISVTDQVMNTTTFEYNQVAHYLTDIIDPRGETPAKMVYDNDGRLTKSIDADGNEILFNHDIAGRQEVVTNRRGHPTVYVYDDEGNVTSMTDARGGVTSYTYDAEGNELTITDPNNNTTTMTYDANNNVTSEEDALGRITSYDYDTDNQLEKITDDDGNETNFGYDGNRNLLTITDDLSNVTTNTYDAKGRLETITDAENNVTAFEYDGSGNRTKETDAEGTVTDYTFDSNGNELTATTTRTTASGSVTVVTSRVYDDLNRVIEEVDGEGKSSFMTYNSIGKLETQTDRNGDVTQFFYDARGNLERTVFPDLTEERIEYDQEGNEEKRIDRLNRETVMTYDELNRLTSTLMPDLSMTSTVYDPGSRVIEQTDDRGHKTTTAYDIANQVTTVTNELGDFQTFTYDDRGNRLTVTDERGKTTTFEYDDINRNTKTTFHDLTFTERTYDGISRVTSQTDQNGIVTSFEYDKLGRLTKVTDALLNETTYTYDEAGNRLTQTDAKNRTTTWSYDNEGRVLSRELPLNQLETFTYDDAGNVITRTDFNGNTTTHEYDDLDRLTKRTFQDTSEYVFTYTDTGQIETETNYLGTTTYTYDSRDRMTRQDNPDGSFLEYTYDGNGNRLTVETGAGTTTYTYDELDRLDTVTDPNLGVTDYDYDKVGNMTQTVHPNGTITTYVYDDLNRLLNLTTTDSLSNVLTSFAYTLDNVGNRLQIAELNRTVDYQYDDLYRLTQEAVTDATNGNVTFDFTYDKVGNRLTRSVDSVLTDSYVYDDNDRVVSAGASSFTYDANGNTQTETDGGGTTTFVYDQDDRLRTVTTPSQTLGYEYDVDGVRQTKVVGGVITRFTVDENRPFAQVLEERDNAGGLLTEYTYGTDLISQDINGLGQYFYHYDGLGSTRAMTDGSETVTDTYNYRAFGELLSGGGSTPNAYQFAGEQLDVETGDYYLRARYLDPGLGRFRGMDSFAGFQTSPITLNKYLYGNSNAINNIDPSGNAALASAVATVFNSMGLSGLATLSTDILNGEYSNGVKEEVKSRDLRAHFLRFVEPEMVKITVDKGIKFLNLQKKLKVGFPFNVNKFFDDERNKYAYHSRAGFLDLKHVAYSAFFRMNFHLDANPIGFGLELSQASIGYLGFTRHNTRAFRQANRNSALKFEDMISNFVGDCYGFYSVFPKPKSFLTKRETYGALGYGKLSKEAFDKIKDPTNSIYTGCFD